MIELLSSGLHTSIQDMGRFGHRAMGVPVSGAMDSISAQKANALVGNDFNSALLEITLQGPIMRFEALATIAVTGAGSDLRIDGKPIAMYKAITVTKGTTLTFGTVRYGVRAYLAVAGGFLSETKLGSASQYQGITKRGMLKKGDFLSFKEQTPVYLNSSIKQDVALFEWDVLEVYPGPEFDLLPNSAKQLLLTQKHTIDGDNNRMAYKLKCDHDVKLSEIITSPVQPGTVQLTPNGTLVVLLRDAQTTGGYARILQLTEAAICVLSQKRSYTKISFTMRG